MGDDARLVWWRVAVTPGSVPRSPERGAAEADLVAVGVAVDHLAHTVLVRLSGGGLDSAGGDTFDPGIEVVDEDRVQCVARAFG